VALKVSLISPNTGPKYLRYNCCTSSCPDTVDSTAISPPVIKSCKSTSILPGLDGSAIKAIWSCEYVFDHSPVVNLIRYPVN
jgi:hypothetical protein